ncbi:MAG: DUF411 domain-containing protein [Sulfurospirillum sp.]|uniref:DUF411 domain-containing protein n=1 Tax=Sulfurospirillum sp. UCH001 TaxID=1581011 RepID=UPI0008303FDF|nr:MULTISPECIES: DUF411 domain-containing protein [unclassified Sulfurospirillum]WNZ00060.1 DUF411 domain-containing protein [Sulfurospirillum sp. 'SP']
MKKLLLTSLLLGFFMSLFAETLPPVTVYKSKYCGCCGEWVKHMENNGFKVNVIETEALNEVKIKYNVPAPLASCHTAIIGNFIVEGHTPASSIKRFLKEAPKDAIGLAVPGMPLGSPGMEQGNMKQPYDVLAFDKQGHTVVFEKF